MSRRQPNIDPRGSAPLGSHIPLSITQLIGRLEEARKRSPLKGNTAVCLSEPEIEYRPIEDTYLETDPAHPEDGAVFLVKLQRED